MPPREGRASSTGVSRDALGLGTWGSSRCHRHRGIWEGVFIQRPSSSSRWLGLEAAAADGIRCFPGTPGGKGPSVCVTPALCSVALPGNPSGSPQPPAAVFSWGAPMRSSPLPISGGDRLCHHGLCPSVLSVCRAMPFFLLSFSLSPQPRGRSRCEISAASSAANTSRTAKVCRATLDLTSAKWG